MIASHSPLKAPFSSSSNSSTSLLRYADWVDDLCTQLLTLLLFFAGERRAEWATRWG
ncbi:hypothetical protein HGRIS_011915 [Hohenbuehelia grisea]|uniref:Uncharacterized protein n=1 Tax=Hohenbuehelia grisea TaxID=104357 RepID=A0ABR3JWI6_9AGAR